MSLLPSRGPDASTVQEGEVQVVGVDEDVDTLLDALSSDTARAVLNAIYEEPGTPSEIADRLEMSIQKVSYHLDKLEERELIAVAGTRYSEKGQEMKVYEPPENPLVLFVGTRERKQSLKAMVKRLLPTIGILALGSLAVERLFGTDGGSGDLTVGMQSSGDGGAPAPEATGTGTETAAGRATEADGGGGGGFDVSSAETSTQTPARTPAETTRETTDVATTAAQSGEQALDAAGSAAQTLSPGAAFFLGGALVLAVVVGWWAYRTYA